MRLLRWENPRKNTLVLPRGYVELASVSRRKQIETAVVNLEGISIAGEYHCSMIWLWTISFSSFTNRLIIQRYCILTSSVVALFGSKSRLVTLWVDRLSTNGSILFSMALGMKTKALV